MLFKVLKRTIERGNYDTKEALMEKISLLYSSGQLTDEEFFELLEMLS